MSRISRWLFCELRWTDTSTQTPPSEETEAQGEAVLAEFPRGVSDGPGRRSRGATQARTTSTGHTPLQV